MQKSVERDVWRLIKGEWTYYRIPLLMLYVVVAPFLVLNAFATGFAQHLAWAMFLTLPILGIVTGVEDKKSRKVRLYLGIPLPLRQIAVARHAVWFGFWVTLVVLFGLSSAVGVRRESDQLPWITLALLDTVIILVACLMIMQDLRFCFRTALLRGVVGLFLAIVPALIAAAYLAVTFYSRLGILLSNLFFKPLTSVLLTLFAAGMMCLSVVVFERRRSYLE